jgi:hypothetical protein
MVWAVNNTVKVKSAISIRFDDRNNLQAPTMPFRSTTKKHMI